MKESEERPKDEEAHSLGFLKKAVALKRQSKTSKIGQKSARTGKEKAHGR